MDSDLIVTLVYFLIIFIGILFFVVQYYISNKKEVEIRVLERINSQKAMELLVNNVVKQFKTLFQLPIRWRSLKKKMVVQLFSWLMLSLLLSSIGILIAGGVNASDQQYRYFKIGTFLYVLSLNCYFISRQYIYYKNQTEAQLHDPRFLALANTNFNFFERNWANYMQIAVLGLEFIQLLSFPIQDIISSINIHNSSKVTEGVDPSTIISIASLLPNISVKFYLIQFWTCMAIVLFTSLSSIIIHFYNDVKIPGISLFWVSHLVPLVHVAYLPILITFINSAACLLGNGEDGNSMTQILKCETQVVQPQLYLWLSLVGFTLAYIMLTIFVTSYERKPLEGDIEFKSKGVAFIKNMSLLLTIDFTLIPMEFTKVKGILSVIILTAVVIYSIHSRPCYVSQINFWRTIGFCCILWSALPVAILDLKTLGTLPIVILILCGWLLILFLSLIGRYCTSSNLITTPIQPNLSISQNTDESLNNSINNNNEFIIHRKPLIGGQSKLILDDAVLEKLSYTLGEKL